MRVPFVVRSRLVSTGILLLAAMPGVRRVGAQARPVASIMLDKGAVEFPEPFSQLSGLVELRDGRVIVVDTKEKELRVVDLSRGTMSKVSRSGGGPLEYQVPGTLLAGAADTVVYFDAMQQRFLRLSPTGTPLGTVPYAGESTKSTATDMLTSMIPTSVDAKGRLYGQTMGMKIGGMDGKSSLMPSFADTVEIQSRDLRAGPPRTLARIRSQIAQSKPKMEMSGTAFRMTITAPNFQPADAWAVLPDGRVAILRDGVYRVHFVGAGRTESTGPLIPFTPVPVTAAERRAMMDSLKKVMAAQVAQIEKTAGPAAAGKVSMEVVEPTTWATTRPPYESLLSSPDGRLWVVVPTPLASKLVRLDVLDASGVLVAHVQLATGERLLALGRGAVYTIRTDQDDLQYLRKYPFPK